MLKNLYQFFREQKAYQLDNEAKKMIYASVQKRIKNQFGILRTISYRSKLVSVSIVVALSFSILQYAFVDKDTIGRFVSHFRLWDVAQADYIGTIVSRNGDYQVLYENKIIDTNKTDNQIPAGSSLVVSHWSKVFLKTHNNSTADITWPAKVTFQKENNQLVVDVAYSDHIDIKNTQPNTGEKNYSPQSDMLVVKTDSKTITAKTNALDISLETKGTSQIIKNNNDNEISITSSGSSVVFALKPKESVLLDAELTLFVDKVGPYSSGSSIKYLANTWSTTTWSTILSLIGSTKTWNVLWTGILYKSGSISVSWLATGELDFIFSASWFAYTEYNNLNSGDNILLGSSRLDSVSDELLFEKKEISQIVSGSAGIQQKTKIAWSGVTSIDALLESKLLLNDTLFSLLNNLYLSYYSDTQDVTVIGDLIKKLCTQLNITCNPTNTKDSIRKINLAVTGSYIITTDVKLIKLQ